MYMVEGNKNPIRLFCANCSALLTIWPDEDNVIQQKCRCCGIKMRVMLSSRRCMKMEIHTASGKDVW